MKKLVTIPAFTLAAISGMFSLFASPAYASSYNGIAAAGYADQYATSRNTASWPAYSDDCTNFASQALYAGGMPMNVLYNLHTGLPVDTSDDRYWFYQNGFYSHSWQVAWNLWDYLINHTNEASHVGTYAGNIGDNQYNTLSAGDLIGYNWGDSTGQQYPGQPTHWAVEVGYGTDPSSGWVGDYVDAHSNDHYHAYWTLQPYNNQYESTTQVFTVSITY